MEGWYVKICFIQVKIEWDLEVLEVADYESSLGKVFHWMLNGNEWEAIENEWQSSGKI